MYVVIAGGGRIGRYIARDMSSKGHEVTIIERLAERCEQLVADAQVLVIQGDACDVRYLEQAHADRADVFVATTHDDDENLVACQLAKIEFGLPRAISRVNTPKNVEIFAALGIEPVSSTRLISELLENEFSVGELHRLVTLKGGSVELVELKIPDPDEATTRPPEHISDIDLPGQSVLVAIFRGDETIIPTPDTPLLPGDEVVALTSPEREDDLIRALLKGR
ncbi:MAG: NAD-binding protein [Nitriliruptoraceae bacterium]